jgi:penicillin amidase
MTIFNAWYKHLAALVFTDANAGPIAKYLQARKGIGFGLPQGGSVLLSAIEGKSSSYPMKLDYLGGLSAEQVMVNALRKAVRELTRTMGPDPQKWLLSVEMSSYEPNNYLGVTTGTESIRKFPVMRRGTENHIVVLSPSGVRGVDIVPPGQSGVVPRVGHPSPHFADQADMFIKFEYKAMHFYPQDVEFSTRSVEKLQYAPAAR